MDTETLRVLHVRALDADDVFHATLREAYGKRAGDMRYASVCLWPANVRSACAKWVKANDKWLAAYREVA